jgi:hypothetical protein
MVRIPRGVLRRCPVSEPSGPLHEGPPGLPDVLPIALVRPGRPWACLAVTGTGFVAAEHVLLTCRDAVERPPARGCAYAALLGHGGALEPFFLENVDRDRGGSDLVTANVLLMPRSALRVIDCRLSAGAQVWMAGYRVVKARRGAALSLPAIVTADSMHARIRRPLPLEGAYELDVRARDILGFGGTPLLAPGTGEVVGVVAGRGVGSTSRLARAHDTRTLLTLHGAATGRLALSVHLHHRSSAGTDVSRASPPPTSTSGPERTRCRADHRDRASLRLPSLLRHSAV